jgi:hypothetical protein
MKIAIVGAGWVGCHLALKLKDKYDVTLYEEDEVFSKTSLKNQNRLHLGFHYARSSSTRELCKSTFNRFLNEYSNLVSNIPNNIYAIPTEDSLIDLSTYIKIFEDWDYDVVYPSYLTNVEGSIRVDEKYIDPIKAKKFFTDQLRDIIVKKKISKAELTKLQKENNLVINCTNNVLDKNENVKYELNTLFIYEKTSDIEFGALTLVDGELFSIFPYLNGTYLVSHVKYSPDTSISNDDKVSLIEKDILKYLPSFKENFKLVGVNESYKSKVKNAADPRVPVVIKKDNLLNIFTGKIQGVFPIEDYVNKEIRSLNAIDEADLKSLFNKYLERDPSASEYAQHSGKDKKDFEEELSTCLERVKLLKHPRVAILISGHPRGMNFLKTSHLINQPRVDFFVFSWDQRGKWGEETNLELASIEDTLDREYSQEPRIKKYVIESNKDYMEKNPIDPTVKFFRYSRVSEIYMKSQLYGIMRSYQLMEEYMKETGIKYDIVVKTRFEMGIKKFSPTKELVEDVNGNKIIFFPNAEESGHGHPLPSFCTKCDTIYKKGIKVSHIFSHDNPVCDTYAYGSVESMKKYCYLHEEYDNLCRSFEEHNLSVIDKINISYTMDGENYVINNDLAGQRFLFCSYPERLFMHYLEGYLLPKAEHIILAHGIT